MHGHAVVGEQGVQERAENAPLWCPSVEEQRGGDVKYPHHLGAARQEVSSLMMSLEGTMVLNAEL